MKGVELVGRLAVDLEGAALRRGDLVYAHRRLPADCAIVARVVKRELLVDVVGDPLDDVLNR